MGARPTQLEAKVFAKLKELTGQGIFPSNSSLKDPIAVAFSGGGDSTALLSLVLKWAGSRPVYGLIVDHGLRDGSKHEAYLAQKQALAMGARAEILNCHWQGGIPKAGIQEKARKARYHILARACEDIGASQLLLGHNIDDQAETVLMRQKSGSGWRGLAGMAERAIYPVWPILPDLVVLRPLLAFSRKTLRVYNVENGLEWIDDPSNENRQFTRIRLRDQLSEQAAARQNLLLMAKAARETVLQERREINQFIQVNTRIYQWGGMALLPGFSAVQTGKVAEALKYLIPAVCGQEKPPKLESRMRLAKKLKQSGFGGATLGGVRFVPRKDQILCVRDPGAVLGRGQNTALPALNLNANTPEIWDGRFKVMSSQEYVCVTALGQLQEQRGHNILEGERRSRLNKLPQAVRSCLPVFVKNDSILHIPFVDGPVSSHQFSAVSCIGIRLASLLG